jgi:hypothetical protein
MVLLAKNFPIDESECGTLTHYSGKYYVANYDGLNDRVKAYVNESVKNLILKHEDLSTCVSLWIPYSIVLTQSGYLSGKDIRVQLDKPLLENVKAILAEKKINRLFCVFQNAGLASDSLTPIVFNKEVPSTGDCGWTVAFIQHGSR